MGIEEEGEAGDVLRAAVVREGIAQAGDVAEPAGIAEGDGEVLGADLGDGAVDGGLGGGDGLRGEDGLHDEAEEIAEGAAGGIDELIGERAGAVGLGDAAEEALEFILAKAADDDLAELRAIFIAAGAFGIVLPEAEGGEEFDRFAGEDEFQPRRDGVNDVEVGDLEQVFVIGKNGIDAADDGVLIEGRAADLFELIEEEDDAGIVALELADRADAILEEFAHLIDEFAESPAESFGELLAKGGRFFEGELEFDAADLRAALGCDFRN